MQWIGKILSNNLKQERLSQKQWLLKKQRLSENPCEKTPACTRKALKRGMERDKSLFCFGASSFALCLLLFSPRLLLFVCLIFLCLPDVVVHVLPDVVVHVLPDVVVGVHDVAADVSGRATIFVP